MYNWSVDAKRLKKDKEVWEKWKLEQIINFGLRNEKISKTLLLEHWSDLDLDLKKKKFLEFLLRDKK